MFRKNLVKKLNVHNNQVDITDDTDLQFKAFHVRLIIFAEFTHHRTNTNSLRFSSRNFFNMTLYNPYKVFCPLETS